MEGWAGSVMGAMEVRVEGTGEGLEGYRIGDMKGLRSFVSRKKRGT